MPIYAYRCSTCGYAKDVLQKMSDPVLTECPECHASTFLKQVTAAGFQLKGSGWYVTDFRGGDMARPKAEAGEGAGAAAGEGKADGGSKGDTADAGSGASDAKPDSNAATGTDAKKPDVKAASPAPAPASAPPAAPPAAGSK